MDKPSKAVLKSLKIIGNNPGLRPEEFARLYFPSDHPGWNRRTKCGPYGVRLGGGLVLWAGGWLGKLRAKKLIDEYARLTTDGQELLREAGSANPT